MTPAMFGSATEASFVFGGGVEIVAVPGVQDPIQNFNGAAGGALLHTWYRYDSVTVSSGANVLTWDDKSGNGNDADTLFGNQQLVSWNGQQAVDFDGTLDALRCSGLSSNIVQPCAIWIACQFDAGSSIRTLLTGTSANQPTVRASTTSWQIDAGTGLTTGTGAVVNGTKYWLGAFFGGTDTLDVNLANVLSGNAGSNGNNSGFTIGGSSAGTPSFLMDGKIGEIIIVTGTPTAGQLAELLAYRNSIWTGFP